jgi:HemY protein
LTAKAEDLLETDPAGAKAAALEANRLAPDFAPAAVVAAKTLFRQSDIRKGAKILEAAWKAEPHPAVADLYVHARPGDATHDRLHRAQKLQSLRQNNVESSLAVARAALEAHEFKVAREAADAAVRMQPREGAYLLLADIEEAESGDQGKVRQFLAMAVRAPRDPAWVADGFVSSRWAPVSPVTGELDAFKWRVPMERLGQMIDQDEAALHPSLALPVASEKADVEIEQTAEADEVVAGPLEIVDAKPEIEPEPVVKPAPEPAPRPEPAKVAAQEPEPETDAPVRMPDDPGVDPGEAPDNAERRFRLF